MLRSVRPLFMTACLMLASVSAAADDDDDDRDRREPKPPTTDEKAALAQLETEIRGAVVYARKGRIYKVALGDPSPIPLGEGEFARWSPRGDAIAVFRDGAVYVMNADGSGRRKLCDDVDVIDDIPIAFHPSGNEIVFTRRKTGLWAVHVQTGAVRRLDLPDNYTGEMRYSADGKRLATRVGRELYAVDVGAGTQRKYAFGCSPGVSPDGSRLMNNVGGHKALVIRDWDGANERRLDTKAMRPDREWNNHMWSNHADYIAAQGENGPAEAYVVKVSANRPTRVTWHGRVSYPDLFVNTRAGR